MSFESLRKIAVVGACECGIAYIDPPDSIDSGATFRCEADHPIVFDVSQPGQRAEAYAEQKRLRDFIRALFEKSGWPEGGDIEAGDFQDLAVEHGLLKPETVTAPCGDNCFCAEYHGDMAAGVTCYRKVAWLTETIGT